MLARVHKRGRRVGGLLRYLLGPGRVEEHVNSRYPQVGTPYGRLVACSEGAAGLLQPTRAGDGRWDYRPLVGWLEAPARAAGLLDQPAGAWPRLVHHFSVRLAPEDRWRTVSDQSWGHMIREIMRGAELIPNDGQAGCRWVVVRHGEDHVHVVTTLVRADGRREWFGRDMPRLVDATAQVARRMGLRVVARTGTAHRRPGPGELRKAARLGRHTAGGAVLTVRDELRRRVRAAAAVAGASEEFEARLARQGVRVAYRTSTLDPGRRTGVKFALTGDTGQGGTLVWYGGGSLAPELTWPRLQARWQPGSRVPPTAAGADRLGLLRETERAARQTAIGLDISAGDDAAALAAADCLTAGAWLIEGGPGGRLVEAAERFDQATRQSRGTPAPALAGAGTQLRGLAQALFLLGQVATDEEEQATLRMMYALAVLVDRLARLAEQQGHVERAGHARAAAATIHAETASRRHWPNRPVALARMAGSVPGRPTSPAGGLQAPRPVEPPPVRRPGSAHRR